MIDEWTSVRPDNDPTTWDLREEARKLLGIQQQKSEVGSQPGKAQSPDRDRNGS